MKITQLVTGPLSVNTWCIFLDSRRVVVVDPGGDADLIIAHLEETASSPVCFLLTHGHFDHMIALPELARTWPGAPIAIHRADSAFLGEGALERHYGFFTELGAGPMVRRYGEELPQATSFLEEGKPVALPGLAEGALPGWSVIHTPGHSPGSICLYNSAEGILISGDTLFNSGFGRTDAPGGSFDLLSQSLTRLFKLPPETRVLPGHGAQTTIGREKGC